MTNLCSVEFDLYVHSTQSEIQQSCTFAILNKTSRREHSHLDIALQCEIV
jgi:hypothetical protein